MDRDGLWQLIDQARAAADNPADADEVASLVAGLLTELHPRHILAADQTLGQLLADSYRQDLWAAAYLINGGGALYEGFDRFRGWLIAQGRGVFELALASPDNLADVPAVIHAADAGEQLECEDLLSVATHAYEEIAEKEFPPSSAQLSYPEINPDWDLEDAIAMAARLPRLAALFTRSGS